MAQDSSLADLLDGNIPLWIYFTLIVVAMGYITINPLGLTVPVSEKTKAAYELFDSLNEGDIVFICAGYSTGTLPMMEPGLVLYFKHAMKVKAKLVIYTGSVEQPMLMNRVLDRVQPEAQDYLYGRDWIHLGYIAGGESALASMLVDIQSITSVDYLDNPISELELMQELDSPTYEKFSLVIYQGASGGLQHGFVRQVAVRYNIPLIEQPDEMAVPGLLPYYPLRIKGILAGGVGAAEYETYSGWTGDAVKLSDIMTMAGLVVLIFLVIGNIGWLMKRMEAK